MPPKAGVPFPGQLGAKLVAATIAALTPEDPADRWIAVLEAVAFAPVRTLVTPVAAPAQPAADLVVTVTRLAPLLPQVAALFGVEVSAKAPTPKPLRPTTRKKEVPRPGGGASGEPRGDVATHPGPNPKPARPPKPERPPRPERKALAEPPPPATHAGPQAAEAAPPSEADPAATPVVDEPTSEHAARPDAGGDATPAAVDAIAESADGAGPTAADVPGEAGEDGEAPPEVTIESTDPPSASADPEPADPTPESGPAADTPDETAPESVPASDAPSETAPESVPALDAPSPTAPESAAVEPAPAESVAESVAAPDAPAEREAEPAPAEPASDANPIGADEPITNADSVGDDEPIRVVETNDAVEPAGDAGPGPGDEPATGTDPIADAQPPTDADPVLDDEPITNDERVTDAEPAPGTAADDDVTADRES